MKGLKYSVKKSKTDQFGEGSTKALPYFENNVYCPVTTLKRWLNVSKIVKGPIFRRFF